MGRTIYGTAVRRITPTKACCDLGADFADKVFLEASSGFIGVIDQITDVIDAMIRLRTETLFIGKINVRSAASPPIMTRLMWAEQNRGYKFSKMNPIHILQLKDMYLQLRQDWKQDPLLIKLAADEIAAAAAAASEQNLIPVP
jgi:hypothetical protein